MQAFGAQRLCCTSLPFAPAALCPHMQHCSGRTAQGNRTHSVSAASKSSGREKAPIILPGEDPDPLRWVRNAREIETDTVVAPLRRRPQPNEDAQDGSVDEAAPSGEPLEQPQKSAREVADDAVLPEAAPKAVAEPERAPNIRGPKAVKRHLRPLAGVEEVLDACEAFWPKWADNGCRKVNLQGSNFGNVRGPRPDEAAAALRVVAVQMINRLSGSERLLQARDRRILGLVEALGAAPPRPPPGEGAQDFADGAAAASSSASWPAKLPDAWHNPIFTTDALWALSVIGGPVLFEAEMEALIAHAALDAEWRPSLLSDALWALGLAHHWTRRLPELEALLLRLGGVSAFTAREAASSLWAFATLGHTPDAALQEIDAAGGWHFEHPWPKPGKRLRDIEALTGKQLISVAWVLAAMERVQTPPFTWVWQEIGRRGIASVDRQPKTLMQLHQVAIAVGLEGSAQQQPDDAWAPLLAEARGTWEARVRAVHDKKESYHQGQVANALVALGRFHVREDTTSGYAIDLVLPEARIAIECDGPSHYARNAPGAMLLGHAQLKHRHLAAMGWKVISVPWTEWDQLLGPTLQQEYVSNRIETLERQSAAAVGSS